MNHAGNKKLANSLLVCLGGMQMIRRFNVPLATASSFSATILWCRPAMKFGHTALTKGRKFSRAAFDVSSWPSR
jgi:hypothetical protein